MAKIIIYDATKTDQEQITKQLERTDHYWVYVPEKISTENLDPEAEVISVFVTSAVTSEMLDRMPKLKLIACRSTGFNNIDMDAAEARGVTVTNVPTYGENTVAEYAFTLLLSLMRKIPQTLQQKEHVQAELMGSDLAGKTIGVIGTGHIGQKSIAIAKGFGMNVIAFDPFPNEQAAAELGFTYKSFDEVLADSDVITLHAPLTEQTKHIINAEALSKMKPTAFLINTARGELVHSKALIIALSQNELAGAALDVIEGEALMKHDEELALLRADQIETQTLMHSTEILALSRMENVIVTPHNAFNTIEAVQRINNTTCQNMIRFWYDEVPNKVKPPKKGMGRLLMVRHTESEWNATGQWTGTRDVHLSENGFRESAMIGHEIAKIDIKLDVCFCSEQIRTLETLEAILNSSMQLDVPIRRAGALNERDYGDYTGMNKWQVKEEVGEEQWNQIRRGWDVPVPNGETLKDVFNRVKPYYLEEIVPLLKQGKNVLVVAHGNSLRALMKYIDMIPDEQVAELEMLFGDIVEYKIDENGQQAEKHVMRVDFQPLHDKYNANVTALEAARNIISTKGE